MSRKNRERKSNQPIQSIEEFSDKERAIIEKEFEDEKAPERNFSILTNLLQTDSQLNRLLISPMDMSPFLREVEEEITSQSTLEAKTPDSDEFVQKIYERIAPMMDPFAIADFFYKKAKDTKVKQQKKVLLWAAAEILINAGTPKGDIPRSAILYGLVVLSLSTAENYRGVMHAIMNGKEPYDFNYEQIIEDTYPMEKLDKLQKDTINFQSDIQFSMDLVANELAEKLSKPFGVPFCAIPSYAQMAKRTGGSSTIITSPNETNPAESMSDEEKENHLALSMRMDILMGFMNEFSSHLLRSLEEASFGELQEDERKMLLNSAAYLVLFPSVWSRLWFTAYRNSGEKFREFNPEQDHPLIAEILASPNQPEPCIRYADHLLEREEVRGGYNMLRFAAQLYEEPDPDLLQRIYALDEKIEAEDREKEAAASDETTAS